MAYKISLAGDLGSGKSTVSKILIGETDLRGELEYYSTGTIFRKVAADMGMDPAEMNVYSETHPELDALIDNGLVELTNDPRNLIIDSRMAWHFTKGTLKIYLTCDPEQAAIRIQSAGREDENFATVEEAAARITMRKESERRRYFDKYGVDCKDLFNYDLIIDSTFAAPGEIAALMADGLKAWKEDKTYKACYICVDRLLYPNDAPDMTLVSILSDKLEKGETLPPVPVTVQNDNFYVHSSVEAVLAAHLNGQVWVKCQLMKEDIDPQNYVKMEDSL